MGDGTIRIGYVSSYNEGNNSASVYYPDRSGSVTSEFSILAPCGMKQKLKKGEAVIVAHLSNGEVEGIILGPIGTDGAGIDAGNEMTIKGASGSVTSADLVKLKNMFL